MTTETEHRSFSEHIRELDPQGAADALQDLADAEIAQTLSDLGPGHAIDILGKFSPERRAQIAAATKSGEGEQWLKDWHFPEGSVGRLMEAAPAIFPPQSPVTDVVEAMRERVKRQLITYIFATDADGKLVGVVTFRELLYALPGQTLADVMVRNPFFLHPQTSLVDAMREVVTRHFPVYPVCDSNDRLIGLVRGQVLFEQQAFEISAQVGSLVGVEKEERTSTPWQRAFRFRHPWLQLNLLTAFVAASVVGYFQETVNQIVLLAVFLPVLSGQCSNTGCQALAVTLRGITLNEMHMGTARKLMLKEAWLGGLNGLFVGLVASIGMYAMARLEHNPHALMLAVITVAAMTFSSVASGIAGAAVPLGMKRLGADPAMASSIFLTTATDVVSMGLFLGMATWPHPLMLDLIDSHSHFDVAEFDADRDAALARARAAGVKRQVIPAIAREGFEKLRDLCAAGSGLHAAYGLHPLFLAQHKPQDLDELEQWIAREHPVAVGECGLDFYVEGLDLDQQRRYLDRQLAIAREHDLPVILHARRAFDEVAAAIRRVGPLRGVVHSFSGSQEQANQFWKLGFHLGIGGPVTYERAHRLRGIVRDMPIELLLLETDSPDQPLAGHQGHRNEPARLVEVCRVVAQLRGVDPQAIADATTGNCERLFALS